MRKTLFALSVVTAIAGSVAGASAQPGYTYDPRTGLVNGIDGWAPGPYAYYGYGYQPMYGPRARVIASDRGPYAYAPMYAPRARAVVRAAAAGPYAYASGPYAYGPGPYAYQSPYYSRTGALLGTGLAVGTIAGVGLFNGWWGSSAFATGLGATAAGSAVAGGVIGVGTIALIDAATQPCYGFAALFAPFRPGPSGCVNGQFVGYSR